MKIAFVTVRPPYPPDSGGRIRTFQLLRRVSDTHEVTLITAHDSPREQAALAALGAALPGLRLQPIALAPETPVGRLWRAIRNPVDPLPYTWARYCRPRFVEHLRRALRERPYDLVHCDHVQVAHAFATLATPARVLNLHNVESLLIRRLAAEARPWWRRMALAWQASKVVVAETRILGLFDRCLAVSKLDAAEIQRLAPGTAVSVVPNGVDLSQFTPSVGEGLPHLLVFSGAMDWLPNIDGVRYFVREVLPRIRQRHAEAELLVVGRNPSDSLVRELAGGGVRFTGTVDDVRPHLAQARLVIVPLRAGGGTRLKILEAWALGKPVLSTTIGAEGLPAEDGKNIALADSPDAFAQRAVQLLSDPRAAATLAAAGRRVVEEHYGWDRVAHDLLEAYELTRHGLGDAGPSAPCRSTGGGTSGMSVSRRSGSRR